MFSQDEITTQQKLLAAYRRTLAVLLQQYALLGGAAQASPGLINSIEEARTNIARIKMVLRDGSVQIDDESNDEAPTMVGPSTSPDAMATGFGQPNWKMSGNASNVAGDQRNINTGGGDYAEGAIDKRRGIFWNQARIPLLVAIVVILILIITSIIVAGANLGGFKQTLQNIGIFPRDLLPISPEQSDETLIIVVPFFRTDGVMDTDEAHTIQRRIRQDIQMQGIAHVRVEVADGKNVRAEDRAGVIALLQPYHASMVIWGSNTGAEVLVNYLNLRQPDFQAADVSLQETGQRGRTQLANPQAYAGFITQDLPNIMTFLSLFAVGQSAYMQRDYPTATHIISNALDALNEIAPRPQGTADAYFLLGWLYEVSEHDQVRAKPTYDQAISLDPKLVAAYNNRGLLYAKLGQSDRALADYTQAITLNPKYVAAYTNRGILYVKLGQSDKALVDFNQAIMLTPNDAKVYDNRGSLYDELGQSDKALVDFNQAITLNPKYAMAYYNRGLLYRHRGQNEEALADYTQAITLNHKFTEAYTNRGSLYDELGQSDKALADYTQAITLNPKFTEAYTNRGSLYAKLGESDKALVDLAQAITLTPKDAEAYYNRGLLYRQLGQSDKALADLAQAITLNPKLAVAYYLRGVLYQERGERNAAIAEFQKARDLFLFQNPQYVQAASDRLKELGVDK